MYLTKNFNLEEFQCPCCGKTPDPESYEFKYFVGKLQDIRDLCKFPLHINSGFRCKKHNKSLPNSSPNSSHLIGLAVDIAITNDFARLMFIRYAIECGIRRVGIGKTYIHVDTDFNKNDSIWLY